MDTITTRELKERLDSLQGQEVTLLGWIRNHRKQKNMQPAGPGSNPAGLDPQSPEAEEHGLHGLF